MTLLPLSEFAIVDIPEEICKQFDGSNSVPQLASSHLVAYVEKLYNSRSVVCDLISHRLLAMGKDGSGVLPKAY